MEGVERKVLEIVNFVYGNYSTQELVNEAHTHSQWKSVEKLIPHNPKINFDSVSQELVSYYQSLFLTYSDFDFCKICKEKINGNIYYYDKDSFNMTDEMINKLSSFEKFDDPKFLELINGELVVS